MQRTWVKSTHSNAEGNCAELMEDVVAPEVVVFRVRDSKDILMRGLMFSSEAWTGFVSSELVQV